MIPERPSLRPIDAHMQEVDGERVVVLRDPLDLTDAVLVLPMAAAVILNYCNGERTIEDVVRALEADHGVRVEPGQVRDMLETLDTHTFLDSPTYHETRARIEREFAAAPLRAAALAGRGYPAEAEPLRNRLDELFTDTEGPGAPPTVNGPTGTLAAAIIPHIDFARGGPTYGHGIDAIAQHADADVFVVLGTGHGDVYNRYTATWKGFDTPFGPVQTDTDFLDAVQAQVPFDLTADEFAHRGEHSIEFQAVLLQYLYAGKRDIRIVPILCGSFRDFVEEHATPLDSPGVRGMVSGLRAATEAATAAGRRVCFIASADLAHVGPKFGDPMPADDAFRSRVADADLAMLAPVLAGDAAGLFDAIRQVGDERRVCGLPSIYTMLEALGPTRGELLQYRQWPDPNDCVTFASVAFHAV